MLNGLQYFSWSQEDIHCKYANILETVEDRDVIFSDN